MPQATLEVGNAVDRFAMFSAMGGTLQYFEPHKIDHFFTDSLTQPREGQDDGPTSDIDSIE
jgi:hypothetical protein